MTRLFFCVCALLSIEIKISCNVCQKRNCVKSEIKNLDIEVVHTNLLSLQKVDLVELFFYLNARFFSSRLQRALSTKAGI